MLPSFKISWHSTKIMLNCNYTSFGLKDVADSGDSLNKWHKTILFLLSHTCAPHKDTEHWSHKSPICHQGGISLSVWQFANRRRSMLHGSLCSSGFTHPWDYRRADEKAERELRHCLRPKNNRYTYTHWKLVTEDSATTVNFGEAIVLTLFTGVI